MNLGELIVDLSLDYAEFNQSLEQAKKAASSAAASIEKSFQKLSLSNPAGTDKSPQKLSLKVEVDDSALYSLNKHLALKDRHFKEVNQYFKNNPLTPTVDDRELTNLNKELAQLTGKNAGGKARVSVDVEVNKEKADLIINNNNNSKEIVEQLKSVEKAVIDSAELSLGRSLGTGLTEEFGRTIGRNLMSGFKKNLGLDIAGATRSFTRVVSKPLSKVTPESIQKFEDDIVSALEEAFVFKNQSQAEEKFKAAFQPIVSEIQEIAYAAAGQVLKVGAQPFRIRKRVLLAQSAQEAAKMSENVNVPDNEDIKKAKSISLITGGIDFQKGGLNTFFAENLVKRVLPGSYSVPVTNPSSNDKNNLGQIYQFRSNLSKGLMTVGPDGVERPASEPMPLDMLLYTNLEKGYNPDSVKMAAEAIAYRKKYPDKPIQLAGTSGGSYVVEEAIAILERAGITNVKGLGLTAPVNNLMTTASQANYRSLVGEFDPLNVAMFGGKNVTDKEHPVYKATIEEMPFGMPGLMEESPLMSLIPGAGKGHALLPFLTKPMVNEQIKLFLGDAIDPVSSSFSKGMKSEPNLHFFKSQLDEKDSLVRTFKAVLGDGSTLRQIKKAGFSGAEGYTFAVPQKPDWRREHDFSSMMGNLPNARLISKDVKPEFDEYTAFLEEMRAGIVEFLDSGAKSKQSLAKTLEKAIKFYPELKTLQTRVLETLGEQARLTDLNKNPKKDTRTAREKYADNQRLARINAQFPQGQEYLKDFRNREKDKDLVPEARAGLESARNIAAQFNKSFATLQTLAKSGNLEEAAMLAASIKQMGVKAREEIKLITKSLSESSNIGSTRLGSQLGQTLGQISSVQKKTDRIVSVNKLSIPNIDTVGVGENTIDGMRQGMEKELEKLKATAEKIPNTVTDVVTEKLKIQSPSEIMMGYGENTGDGYGIGVERSLSRVKEIVKSGIDDIAKSFDFVSQDPTNPGEELTSGLHDWYLSHRTSFDPSKLNNILGNGLISKPSSVQVARELELFGRSGTVYSALRHKQYGMDNIKNEAYGAIEFLIDPSRIANKTTWLPQDSSLERYQSLEEIKKDYGQKGLHFRQLNSVLPKASLMKNYEGNSGYVEAQTHAPVLPSDISAIRIGSSQISPDQLYKKHGDSLLAFIRTALSKNIKVIGDFSSDFLRVAESVGININKGQSEGIRKSANEPIKAISEVAHQTIEKATEGLAKVSEIHQLNPAPIQQISKKPNIPESEQKMMDEFNRMLAALQGKGEDVGSGLSKGINSSLGDVESSSEKLANTVIDTVEKKLEIQSPSRWGIRVGRFVGEGFTKGLEFLEGGNNGIIPIFIKVMNDIKSTVENGEITSSAEDFKNRLSRGFSRGLGSVPGFKDAKQRFEDYKTFLKEVANPSTSAALGEGLANGIVTAKELFVDFLKIPEKLVEGFNQVKVAFDSFVEGMNKVQKFGEIMDFLKSSIGNVVKVLGLLVVGKIILDLAPASIEVAANFENLERRIRFTSGSISEGAKNIAFLRSEAKRLNVSLSQTLEGGSKFFQATKDTPIEGYQSRQVVSAVTQASAVYGLDPDNQQRTFTALEQMSGKTVVSQEELRQQLAEAIPNASQIAANAYGTTTQSMNKLLSTGRVLAEDFLPKFAQQLKAQTSSGVGDAVNSSVAITNKFNNSLTELQESIGKTLLPFRNFSLGIFASGIDLVTNNFQLLQSVLLITLIKLGSPVWMMFGAYLKEIAFSGNLVKGALLGMGQSIATLGKQMFILSMAMKAIDEIMMNFKDNSGAIGEQTRNVTQSINEQRKILNQQASVTETDDFSAFRERFSLNPFDNSTKKLKKQMEDSAKRTLEGRENTKNLLDASNSPAVQGAIQEIQAIDKSLDLIKMRRRAVIANNPGDIQELRKLQSQEKELSQRREKPLELFGGNKGNLDKQVETLKTYLEYWEELKKNPKLYQSEIEQINKIISTTKDDLAIVTAEQEKMVKAIKNSLTEMQKFAIEIRNIEAKFNDVRQARDTVLSSRKFNLFNYATNGVIQPGQVEYTNNLLTQVDLISKIADNLKQVREMSAQLNINGLDDVLQSQGLNKDTGIDTLKAAQERSIDGSKEKEILSSFIEVKKMQVQTVDMQQQLSEQRYNVTQSLHQQTKQVADYYRTAVREAKAVGVEFQKAQVTLQNSNVQNRLREALIGAGDNIYTQFVEGIINIISQTADIQKQQLEVRKQRIDYENNIQDIRIQAAELQRSLPGKIIPLDSSIADNFNLSLFKIDGTVDTINDGVKDVASSLSKGVVDAARKANTELDKLNGTFKNLNSVTDNWLDGFGNKITDTLGKLNLSVGVQANVENNTPAWAANALEILQNTPINTDSTAKLTPTIPINPVIPANTIVSPIPGKTLFELTKTKFSSGQEYGASRDGGRRRHQGIDFGVNAGLKDGSGIVSMLPGLASARWYDKEAKTIVVEVRTKIPNGNKIDIKYGHIGLESAVKALGIKLEKDDISSNVVDVNAGQWIGNIKSDKYSGNNPANAHLHLEVIARRQNGYAVLNPKQFIDDLFRANQKEQPNIFKRIFRKITGTQVIPEARELKPFDQSIAPVGQLPAAKTSSPVNPATQLQTTQVNRQPNSIADWPMPQQQATKSIILIPGHRIDIKTGTGGTSQTGSLNYKGENRTIESIGTEQAAKVFEKVLMQKGFKLIPAPSLPSARGDQARRDYQTEVAKLEKEKNAYALELHFDSPKGKPGVIPGGQYDPSGKYLNQMDVSLASKFGAFSYFWGVGGKDVRQNPGEHLGAPSKGITILELDKLDAKLTKLIEQGVKTGDFTDFEKAITPYAINAAEGLILAFTPSAKQSPPVPKLPNLPNLDPRIDTKFLQDVSKIAQSVGANPEDLLKVMLYETGGTLSPSIRNPRTKATGLIQFMPATARGLGTNIDALSQMTPQEQLFFVQKYLKQNSRGQKLDSFRKVLSTVFAGNPNASLGVGDGDITLGNYLKKAESRYGNTARQLTQIVVDGKAIDPDSMQSLVTEAAGLKLDTANKQREMNRVNSSLSIEQIRENELRQRLEAYRLIMSSQRTAFGDISSTKDSTLGTRRTVLEGLSPNMSNAGRFGIQIQDLQRKLEKDVEALQQIIRDTDGAIAQKPDLQAAFDLAMKKFPNDPKLAADAIETNDLSFKATAFRNAEAKNNLAFLQSNINNILIAAIEDYDKKELFRFKEQSISGQTKVIEQLQQQLQLVQKLEEADPLNPLVLSIPALQKNIESLSITRDQYQQLLDLQRRYYDGGGKGGNMSEEAFQKEFRAILNVNSVKREGIDLNFNYADTVKRIKFATDELTKAQTLQSSQADAIKIRSDRFNLQNKETGLVDIQGIKDQFALDSESANIAFQKLVLENSGDFSLSSQERLLKTLRDYRNFVERQNLSVAENINAIKEGELKNQQVVINKAFAEREAALNYESRSSNIENLKSDYANPFHVNALKRQLEGEKLKLEYDKSLADLNFRLETESLGGVVRPEGYAESLKTDLLNNYLEKVKQVNRESKDFNSTIKDIAQQQLTSLSSGLTDVIMGTKSFGDALNSITNAFLSGALNALFNSWFSGKSGIGSLFGDIGKSLGFSKGGVVPNYADGGVIGSIGDALQRERQASGVKPVLAALTPGERVLTVRQNKRFEELQMEKVLNYADGGVVGRAVPSMSFTAPSQSSSVNIDIPINVSNGDSSASVDVPQLRNSIRSAVLAEIQRQQRPGGALNK